MRVFMKQQQLRGLRGSGKLEVSLTPCVCVAGSGRRGGGGGGGGPAPRGGRGARGGGRSGAGQAVLERSSPLPLWEKENYSRASDPGNCPVLPWADVWIHM